MSNKLIFKSFTSLLGAHHLKLHLLSGLQLSGTVQYGLIEFLDRLGKVIKPCYISYNFSEEKPPKIDILWAQSITVKHPVLQAFKKIFYCQKIQF